MTMDPQTNAREMSKAVFTADSWTDMTRSPVQVDPVTRRVIGHARQRHEADWLHGCSARTAVQFSLV